MKNTIRITIFISLCALVAGLVGCQSGELDTDQYSSKKVRLVSYGPNPVMRGATLTFIGSNLDRIIEVQVPGVEPITSIEVVASGFQSEIRVQLPVEGPEPGNVILKASDGETFTTETALEYSEPIVFDDFTPKNAMPGDVISLKGDYMNLVKNATFEGGAVVEVETVDRHNAKVVVPSEAVTGKIILSDEAEIPNLIYSEDDLVIGDPTVTSVSAPAWKPGQEATISGTYLGMIQKVILNENIEVSEFTVSEDGRSLMFEIPSETKSGDINAVSFAGKEFKAGTMEMVKPSSLSVSPKPVKAGAGLVISGKDLDIVTRVDFPGVNGVDFTYEESALKIAEVPATATAGDITLSMANGDQVSVTFTLVVPAVTGMTPTELVAGGVIELTGTDLDLVSEVTIGGKTVEFTASKDKITITTSATSASGKIVLVLANGTKVECPDEITFTYDSLVSVTEMTESALVGEEVTMTGTNFMLIETIYVGESKVTGYVSRTDTEITFKMPENEPGTYDVYFNLQNGDRETCSRQLTVVSPVVETEVWSGSSYTGANYENNLQLGTEDDWNKAGLQEGDTIFLYFSAESETDWQIQLFDGHWGALSIAEIGGQQFNAENSPAAFSDGYVSFKVSASIFAALTSKQYWGNALIVQGKGVTVTKLSFRR